MSAAATDTPTLLCSSCRSFRAPQRTPMAPLPPNTIARPMSPPSLPSHNDHPMSHVPCHRYMRNSIAAPPPPIRRAGGSDGDALDGDASVLGSVTAALTPFSLFDHGDYPLGTSL